MGDEHDGYSHLFVDVFQQLQDGMRSHGVKCAGGLVAQHDGRVVHQGTRNRNTLLLTARKLTGILVALVGQAYQFQQFTSALFRLLLVGMAELKRKHDIAKNRTLLKQTEVLEDHAYRAAELAQFLFGKTRDIAPIDDDRARSRTLKQIEAAYEGRLTSTRLADNAKHGSVFDGQIDISQGDMRFPLTRHIGLIKMFDSNHSLFLLHSAAYLARIKQPTYHTAAQGIGRKMP